MRLLQTLRAGWVAFWMPTLFDGSGAPRPERMDRPMDRFQNRPGCVGVVIETRSFPKFAPQAGDVLWLENEGKVMQALKRVYEKRGPLSPYQIAECAFTSGVWELLRHLLDGTMTLQMVTKDRPEKPAAQEKDAEPYPEQP